MDKQTGEIAIDGDTATIIFERRLSHPIEKVWKAITDPQQRAAWYGPTKIEPEEGGVIETVAEGPPAPEEVRRSRGQILVWDPPHVFEYQETSSNVGNTIVRYELTPDGEETVPRLTNSNLAADDARGYAPG